MKNKDKKPNVLKHKISPTRKFELVTTHGSIFATLFEALHQVLSDVTILISQNKEKKEKNETEKKENDKEKSGSLKISALNDQNTVMVSLTLDNFDIFYCCEKQITIGVNIGEFYRFIKGTDDNDTLILFLDKNNENQLGIQIKGKNKNIDSNYYLNLLNLNEDICKIPKKKFNTTVVLPSSTFQKICKEMSGPHIDKITIVITNGKMTFTCNSESGTQNISISTYADENEKKTDEIIQGIFDIKKLIIFTRCTKLSNSVEIYMNNDEPIYIIYRIPELGKIIWVAATCNVNN